MKNFANVFGTVVSSAIRQAYKCLKDAILSAGCDSRSEFLLQLLGHTLESRNVF